MVLIKKPQSIVEPFNKEKVLEEVIKEIEEKYPDYYLLRREESFDSPLEDFWDLLIIRNVDCTVHEVIGMMNHESITKKRYQQIFGVLIVPNPQNQSMYKKSKLRNCFTNFFVASSSSLIMLKLSFYD